MDTYLFEDEQPRRGTNEDELAIKYKCKKIKRNSDLKRRSEIVCGIRKSLLQLRASVGSLLT